MNTQFVIDLIFNTIEQKIEELGGIKAVKQAIVWEWWQTADINDERDFDSALDQCYRCYLKINEIRDKQKESVEE